MKQYDKNWDVEKSIEDWVCNYGSWKWAKYSLNKYNKEQKKGAYYKSNIFFLLGTLDYSIP